MDKYWMMYMNFDFAILNETQLTGHKNVNLPSQAEATKEILGYYDGQVNLKSGKPRKSAILSLSLVILPPSEQWRI